MVGFLLNKSFYFLFFFGLLNAQQSQWETIVSEGTTWKYIVPTSQVPNNWKDPAFNPSSWAQGASGIGYGDNDDQTVISKTVALFMRKTFEIQDVSLISRAVLDIDYDDGFVEPSPQPVDINFTSSNLPIVILNTDGADIPDEPKIDATMKIIKRPGNELNYVYDENNSDYLDFDGPIKAQITLVSLMLDHMAK